MTGIVHAKGTKPTELARNRITPHRFKRVGRVHGPFDSSLSFQVVPSAPETQVGLSARDIRFGACTEFAPPFGLDRPIDPGPQDFWRIAVL